jgi:CSLREA domain-containing protein
MPRRAREGRSSSLATLIVGLTLMLLPVPVALAKGCTVNSTGDYADVKPGDGICADSRTPPKCTLRAAIQESNVLAGADVIHLRAASYTLTSTLPRITGHLTV